MTPFLALDFDTRLAAYLLYRPIRFTALGILTPHVLHLSPKQDGFEKLCDRMAVNEKLLALERLRQRAESANVNGKASSDEQDDCVLSNGIRSGHAAITVVSGMLSPID